MTAEIKRKVGDGVLSSAQAYDKQEHLEHAGEFLIKATETKKLAKGNESDNEAKSKQVTEFYLRMTKEEHLTQICKHLLRICRNEEARKEQ